jgi:arsenate reductase
MAETRATIFHNPNCGTSRTVLAALEAADLKPTVIEYLKTGWTKPQLKALLADMRAGPRDILRVRGTPAEELGLTSPAATDDQILEAMVAHPILVERPIVQTDKGAVLARPSDKIFELIGQPPG